jgi:uroporphyrinogen decarboxylase
MSDKALLLKALRNEVTPRPAWVPFVGSHGGFLIGVGATEYLTSVDRIVEGVTKAREQYNPDGLPVVFDLQIEAEMLGCELQWPEDGPPSVRTHPLAGREDWRVEDVGELDVSTGRLPVALEATRRLSERMGEEVALYGLVCGPFTLALHLLGNEIFLAMFDTPEKVRSLVERCGEIGRRVAASYIEAGCDVIAVVDPMLSQISPEHMDEFVTGSLDGLFDHIHEAGALASLFVCGDATRNLEAMARTRCDNISIDENVDLPGLRDIARQAGKSFGGNLKLTVSLLLGSEDDCRADAISCIDAAGERGFILAPGCDLPFNTPPRNVAAAGEMAWDVARRERARGQIVQGPADTFDDIELPDYQASEKVLVDVITLDSASCAPCQYMVSAANEAAEAIGNGHVEVREHKIKNRQGIGMLCKLGVSNLPTICIDGEQRFVSVTPDRNTLVDAIRQRAMAKGIR